MTIFKLTKQFIFSGVDTIEINASSCEEERNEAGSVEAVNFYDEDGELIQREDVFADPHYKLLNENDEVVFKHTCC